MWIPVVLTYDVAHVARVAFVDSTGTQLHVFMLPYLNSIVRRRYDGIQIMITRERASESSLRCHLLSLYAVGSETPETPHSSTRSPVRGNTSLCTLTTPMITMLSTPISLHSNGTYNSNVLAVARPCASSRCSRVLP